MISRTELEAMTMAALRATAERYEAKAREHAADPDWAGLLEQFHASARQMRDELARRKAHDEQRAQEAYA